MDDDEIVVTATAASERGAQSRPEICEHKGIGHPDNICDGVADAVSRALSLAYLRAYGAVQHHNVDKALLIGGESEPRFGGGKIIIPMRLIVSGRASPLPDTDMAQFVRDAARGYIGATLRCDPDIFSIESAVHNGSASLRQVFSRERAIALANDTSFGVGYAPYSPLEQSVLRLAQLLRSNEFRTQFPAAGDDYKIMGGRVQARTRFTIALAFIDRETSGALQYFEAKTEVVRYLRQALDPSCEINLNTLDAPAAVDASQLYLTVSGLSAENGDDGEVGRGNRVNGLITPCRPMSLEAAAGKNPVAHVGKIYNVLAMEMARAICAEVNGVAKASVHLLSAIGKPVAEPQLVAIEVVTANGLSVHATRRIRELVRSHLARVNELSERLVHGMVQVF